METMYKSIMYIKKKALNNINIAEYIFGEMGTEILSEVFLPKGFPCCRKKIYTFTKNDAKGTAGYSFYKLKCIT